MSATNDVVHGHCDPRFDKVRAALAEAIESGDEVGAAIAVDIDGHTAVDIWGGYRDEGRTTPWTDDTIVNVWSSTKTVLVLAALMLIDRRLIDPDAPIATYWPEFAANGKGDITIRHLLSHNTGVSGWDPPFTLSDLLDWDTATTRLAAQAPWWPPGTASGYHAISWGHLIGEVLRRVTGSTFKDFVRDEIAGPLGVDFQIGARPEDDGRIAHVIPPPPLELPVDLLSAEHPCIRTFSVPAPDADFALFAHTPQWRAADLGAVNGHSNARALARLLSVISRGGEVDGVRLLRPDTIERIFETQSDGLDQVLLVGLRMGLGYGLPKPENLPWVPDEKLCFWGGWGGSFQLMAPDRRTTISYVMNRMGAGTLGNDRTPRYVTAVFEALA